MGSIININNISDIKPFKSSWSVHVKVLHTWKSFTSQFGSSLEMVLADENGVKIHACCKQQFIDRLERWIHVGEWKVVTNMALSKASGFYRPTNHVFKVSFMSQTCITDSDRKCDNMFLDLQDFAYLQSGSHNICFLIDVIGEVLDLGELGKVRCAGNELDKVEFNLRDMNDQRLPCCIWGETAATLSRECKELNKGVICLIRFAKLGKYRGEFQVSNACDSSLVVINPDIKEAQALKQMFHEDNSIDIYQPKKDKIAIQQMREKWSMYPFKTIQEMRRTDKAGNCRVVCTVYAIDTLNGWYYLACVVCSRKVFRMNMQFHELDVPTWWCEVCQRFITKVSPRYKLQLLVQDQTGESNFMLLDSVANCFVKTTVAKLLNGLVDEIDHQQALPGPIVDIVGKTYGFGVSIDENNISTGVENFKVMKVWNLDQILLKRIKSLHHVSTYSRKKQCTNGIKIETMDLDEANVKKSG